MGNYRRLVMELRDRGQMAVQDGDPQTIGSICYCAV